MFWVKQGKRSMISTLDVDYGHVRPLILQNLRCKTYSKVKDGDTGPQREKERSSRLSHGTFTDGMTPFDSLQQWGPENLGLDGSGQEPLPGWEFPELQSRTKTQVGHPGRFHEAGWKKLWHWSMCWL
jgi:hypothetical protein